jgi:hypothetical protein
VEVRRVLAGTLMLLRYISFYDIYLMKAMALFGESKTGLNDTTGSHYFLIHGFQQYLQRGRHWWVLNLWAAETMGMIAMPRITTFNKVVCSIRIPF